VHLLRKPSTTGLTRRKSRAAGKPSRALVRMAAKQAGEHIVVEISDDGRA